MVKLEPASRVRGFWTVSLALTCSPKGGAYRCAHGDCGRRRRGLVVPPLWRRFSNGIKPLQRNCIRDRRRGCVVLIPRHTSRNCPTASVTNNSPQYGVGQPPPIRREDTRAPFGLAEPQSVAPGAHRYPLAALSEYFTSSKLVDENEGIQ
jgi:hypothetical protein